MRPMLYPAFFDLDGRRCLVVGAGRVARRKIAELLACGAAVTVIAPEGDVADLPVRCLRRAFTPGDVVSCALVIAATSDPLVNRRVSTACRERGIPVNVVDRPELCSFVVPAVARRGDLAIAVSSGGKCPVAAQIARDRASAAIPEGFVAAVAQLSARRAEICAAIPDHETRRNWYRKELEKWNA